MEFDAGEFERVSERMQDDAFDMVAALRQQVAVCDITGLKCTPLSEPVSAVRAVSMDVEMDLHAYFNNI